ncbi:MAG: IS982 family transposase [Blastocatellia bacterium]
MDDFILPLFCDVDDFCQHFEPEFKMHLLADGSVLGIRKSSLCLSEVVTIIIYFHLSGYRTFKDFYTRSVSRHMLATFPNLVSYNRFVELMAEALVPLCVYLNSRFGRCSGISFIDSLPLAVCHNRRIHAHKVFSGLAQRGRSSVDWFYGFKLHLVVNDEGELLAVWLTSGNIDDRKPLPHLTKKLFGKLIGDKGYISQRLTELLSGRGLQLVAKIKTNMKNRLMPMMDKLVLRKRALIETINDQLKNICQVAHSRHRSTSNFVVNTIAALIAYTFKEKKPSLNIRVKELEKLLPALM